MGNFGPTLARILDERGITRRQLAQDISMHPTQLSQLLKRTSVDSALLVRISRALNISPMVFLSDEYNPLPDYTPAYPGGGNSETIALLKQIIQEKEKFINYLLSERSGKHLTAGENIDTK